MKLSEHFTVEEFEYSATAIRLGIANKIPNELLDAARMLCEEILEPLHRQLAMPIQIDSGYRCLALNRAIGSKDNSQHIKAEAADIKVKGMMPTEICDAIELLELPFDQLIEEYGPGGWCHVSYSARNRRMRLKLP